MENGYRHKWRCTRYNLAELYCATPDVVKKHHAATKPPAAPEEGHIDTHRQDFL